MLRVCWVARCFLRYDTTRVLLKSNWVVRTDGGEEGDWAVGLSNERSEVDVESQISFVSSTFSWSRDRSCCWSRDRSIRTGRTIHDSGFLIIRYSFLEEVLWASRSAINSRQTWSDWWERRLTVLPSIEIISMKSNGFEVLYNFGFPSATSNRSATNSMSVYRPVSPISSISEKAMKKGKTTHIGTWDSSSFRSIHTVKRPSRTLSQSRPLPKWLTW